MYGQRGLLCDSLWSHGSFYDGILNFFLVYLSFVSLKFCVFLRGVVAGAEGGCEGMGKSMQSGYMM